MSGLACIWTIADLISFKLGIVIETAELYILMPSCMTFTFIDGHSSMRNQKLVYLFTELVWMNFWFSATACQFVEAHAKFISHNQYSREITLLT